MSLSSTYSPSSKLCYEQRKCRFKSIGDGDNVGDSKPDDPKLDDFSSEGSGDDAYVDAEFTPNLQPIAVDYAYRGPPPETINEIVARFLLKPKVLKVLMFVALLLIFLCTINATFRIHKLSRAIQRTTREYEEMVQNATFIWATLDMNLDQHLPEHDPHTKESLFWKLPRFFFPC